MITIAYVGFGVSVREYHIPYVESRNDIRVKYVFHREQDIAQFADYEPFYPEIQFTTDFDVVLKDPEVELVVVSAPDAFHVPYAKQILNAGKHALSDILPPPIHSDRGGGFSLKCSHEHSVNELSPCAPRF